MPGEATRPMTIQDLIGHRRVRKVEVSPDGDSLAIVVARADLESNRTRTQICRLPAAGGLPVPLTQAGNANTDPAFSPDGSQLAFTSDRSGTNQIWLMPLDGGEARAVTTRRPGARRPVWVPGGRQILAIGAVHRDCSDEAEIARREDEWAGREPRPYISDDLPFRHWDTWCQERLDHLLVVDVATGACRDLTPGPWPVPPRDLTGEPDYAVSPDGTEVCFACLRDPEQTRSTSVGIYCVPLAGGEPRRISIWDGAAAFPRYSPDGRFIAYCQMRRAGYEADRREVLVYDRQTRTTRPVAPDFDRSAGAPSWSPDGETLYFHAQDRGRTRIWAVPAGAGEPGPLTADATDGDPAPAPGGDWIYFTRETFSLPPELFRVASSGGPAERLTRFADEDLAGIEPGDAAEEVRYAGADGLEVHGFIVKPPHFDPTRRYPTLFLIHGGPQSAVGMDFHERWNAQLFAASGRVVVMLNLRGSTGYGRAFTDAIHGEWGGKCYEDLIRGFDHVLDTYPFCDRERTAAAGASFGGYMVNWIAGHTDRFRCLVCHGGIFSTELMNWCTDELWFTEWEFGGAPWEAP